jgi:hypothetical protein
MSLPTFGGRRRKAPVFSFVGIAVFAPGILLLVGPLRRRFLR